LDSHKKLAARASRYRTSHAAVLDHRVGDGKQQRWHGEAEEPLDPDAGLEGTPAMRAAALVAILGNRYARLMMLKHRRTGRAGGSNAANDFSVIDKRGKKIGRICLTLAVGGGHAWNWTVYRREEPAIGWTRADVGDGAGGVRGSVCPTTRWCSASESSAIGSATTSTAWSRQCTAAAICWTPLSLRRRNDFSQSLRPVARHRW